MNWGGEIGPMAFVLGGGSAEPTACIQLRWGHNFRDSDCFHFCSIVGRGRFCAYTEAMFIEWDEAKNQLNFAKHKINFELAEEVFSDPLSQYIFDRFVGEEERCWAVGKTRSQLLLVVVHTYRNRDGKEIVRIISARPASAYERRRYEEG